jgi:hypothetical protein
MLRRILHRRDGPALNSDLVRPLSWLSQPPTFIEIKNYLIWKGYLITYCKEQIRYITQKVFKISFIIIGPLNFNILFFYLEKTLFWYRWQILC